MNKQKQEIIERIEEVLNEMEALIKRIENNIKK